MVSAFSNSHSKPRTLRAGDKVGIVAPASNIKREALEAGADEFIMKPYDREVLLDKLVQIGLAERV